jgi:multiple sugar transport system ATP-binding protein
MADVALRKVVKRYDEVEAVRGIDLDIADHEFIVLVGPSGCGKSTTLRMIAGLEDISDGDILIGGDVVNDVPPKDRDIAMVFQNYALYPHMTVAENMSFGLRLKHYPKAEIKARVTEAARLLDITDLVDRKPKQLSGGQRQRVAMGRAIVRNPKVFSQKSSCSTSRSPISTPSCACRCGSRSRRCTRRCAPRPSTSRTTRSRR